ncbi:MAG: type II toxin-antitoxin system RelE/ParE family toxin [Polyangiales bacterium]
MRVLDAAREELADAVLWYESETLGAGLRLAKHIEQTFARIANNPRAFARMRGYEHPQVRRAIVTRFPYVVIFCVFQGEVTIVAIAHAKRAPFFWETRLDDLP